MFYYLKKTYGAEAMNHFKKMCGKTWTVVKSACAAAVKAIQTKIAQITAAAEAKKAAKAQAAAEKAAAEAVAAQEAPAAEEEAPAEEEVPVVEVAEETEE